MTWSMTAIPPEGLKPMWPTVAPLLAPAIKRSGGRVTMRDLFSGLSEQRYLLWVVYFVPDVTVQAAFVTRVAEYPSRTLLAVDFAGGSRMRGWVGKVQQTFREYARDMGLDGVEMFGRPGWTEVLGRYGWKASMVLVEADAATESDRG